jgi:predicted DNA-binding mobile mystery protein A
MKRPSFNALDRISSKREQLQLIAALSSDHGWIKSMREALGMTLGKLGNACGLAPSTVAQAERGEAEGKITVETLRKAAEAMNCEFTYAFVPKSDLSSFVEKKAYEKAKRILQTADLHMSLEDQQVKALLEPRIQRLKSKLITEGKVW